MPNIARLLTGGLAAAVILAGLPARAPAAAPALEWNVSFTRTLGGSDPYYDSFIDASGNTYFLSENPRGYSVLWFNSAGVFQSETDLAGISPAASWRAFARDSGGNFYLAGSAWAGTTDLAIAKYSSAGALLWGGSYDGGGSERAYNLTLDGSGNVFAVGEYRALGGGKADALLVKFNSSGVPLWAKTVDHGDYDYAYAVAVDGAGNSYMTGPTFLGMYQAQYMFASKFSSAGTVQFSRTYTRSGWDYSRAISYHSPSGTLFIGWEGADYWDSFLGALAVNSSNGNLISTAIFADPSSLYFTTGDIAVSATGTIYVAGSRCCDYNHAEDYFAVAFSSALPGTHQVVSGWPEVFNMGGAEGVGWPRASARIDLDSSDRIFVSGLVSSLACGNAHDDLFLRRLYPSGTTIWVTRYDGPADTNEVEGLAADAGGDSYLGGDAGNSPVMLKRGAAAGNLLWTGYYPADAGHCGLWAGGMGLSPDYAYLSMNGLNEITYRNDIVIARYSPGGGLAGTFSYSRLDNLFAGPVAVDGSGNIYLTGSFFSTTSYENELFVSKLTSGGVVLWTRTVDFAVNDDPVAIALDDLGESLYVLEAEPAAFSSTSRAGVLKFSALDGSLVWTRALGATIFGQMVPGGLAVSGSDVLVAGSDQDDALNPADSAGVLHKLDAGGSTLWTRAFSGSPDLIFHDVAAGEAGDLAVAGAAGTFGPPGSWDSLALSLDAAGEVRWTDLRDLGEADDSARKVHYESSGISGTTFLSSTAYVAGTSGNSIRSLKYTYSPPVGAVLRASLHVDPAEPDVGDYVCVHMTVSNVGTVPVNNGISTITVDPGSDLMAYDSANSHPWGAKTILGNDSATCDWGFTVTGEGSIGLTAKFVWDDTVLGETRSLSVSRLLVGASAAGLSPAVAVQAPSFPVREGRTLTVLLTVTNNLQTGVSNVMPGISLRPATSAAVAYLSGPEPQMLPEVLGDSSGTFTWTYAATAGGSLNFVCTASGLDMGSEDEISVSAVSETVIVRKEFEKELVVFPNPASGDELNVAVDLAGDARSLTVDAYNASLKRAYSATWRDLTKADGQVTVTGLSRWAPGVYLLKVRAELAAGGTQSFDPVKVVIER